MSANSLTIGARLPVLIIHTGDPNTPLREAHGGYGEMMRRAAGLEPHDVHIVCVYEHDQPEAPAAYRAALITGSPAMVTDRESWSEHTAVWIRRAAREHLPMFGVCYGHQLLAHALGGQVGYNAKGRELGTQMIECLPAAADDALMAAFPSHFPAQLVHAQSVTMLPSDAIVLARSAMDPHQCVRLAPNIYSTQFHPEFSPEFLRDHLQQYRDSYLNEGLDVDGLVSGLESTPLAATLVQSFLELYERRNSPQRTL